MILVTGCSGYLGSNICMLAREHSVPICGVDMEQPHASPDGTCHYKFFERDITFSSLTSLLRDQKIETIIHCAAKMSVSESITDPHIYYQTNVEGTLRLLRSMRVAGVKRLIFASSSSVYGDPTVDCSEDLTLAPISPYGFTKMVCERAIADYASVNGLSAIILRPFNIAGTHHNMQHGYRKQPPQNLVPILCEAALNGTPVDIFGECVRDYVHVSDVARAHLLAARSYIQPGTAEIYNVGSGLGWSNCMICGMLKPAVGDIAWSMKSQRDGDPLRLVARREKIQERLGWVPEHDISMILGSAWDWHKRKFNGDHS